MSSDVFPAKTQAISMPYPKLMASKLTSKPDNSFAKRASEDKTLIVVGGSTKITEQYT
jgi:hypothetical protein